MSTLRRDLPLACAAAWLIVSALLFLAAAAPFVFPAEWLFRAAPFCQAKQRGAQCILCGMTTAYAAIGQVDLNAATLANSASLPLWTASVVNFPFAFSYLRIAARRRRSGDNNACS